MLIKLISSPEVFGMQDCAHSAAIHWFRKGLRLHDNPALIEACRSSSRVFPVFCIDPYFAMSDIIGVNRFSFLLESLHDLDMSLRDIGSRLFVLKGQFYYFFEHFGNNLMFLPR